MKVRFYLDENMQIAIAEQLKRRGIEVTTVLLGIKQKSALKS